MHVSHRHRHGGDDDTDDDRKVLNSSRVRPLGQPLLEYSLRTRHCKHSDAGITTATLVHYRNTIIAICCLNLLWLYDEVSFIVHLVNSKLAVILVYSSHDAKHTHLCPSSVQKDSIWYPGTAAYSNP